VTRVISVAHQLVTLSCIMDFNLYPFDKQACYILEGSMTEDWDGKSFVIWGNFFFESKIARRLPYEVKLELLDPELLAKGKLFGDMRYSGWRIALKRKILIHLTEAFMPSTLFVALSWLSFLIPPDVVPGRMALLVTMLLVLVNIFLRVTASVPMSTKITAMGAWIIGGIFLVALALMEYGLILYLKRYWTLRLKKIGSNSLTEREKRGKSEETMVVVITAIDWWSFVLFPVVFFVLAVAYWASYVSKYEESIDDVWDPVKKVFFDSMSPEDKQKYEIER